MKLSVIVLRKILSKGWYNPFSMYRSLLQTARMLSFHQMVRNNCSAHTESFTDKFFERIKTLSIRIHFICSNLPLLECSDLPRCLQMLFDTSGRIIRW